MKTIIPLLFFLTSSIAFACDTAIYEDEPKHCEFRTDLKVEEIGYDQAMEKIKKLAFKKFSNAIHVTSIQEEGITVHDIKEPIDYLFIISAKGYYCEAP